MINSPEIFFLILPPPPPNLRNRLYIKALREVEVIFYPPPILHLFRGKMRLEVPFWAVQTYSVDNSDTTFGSSETVLSGVWDNSNA